MPTIAQCLWVKRDPADYYPFVADQICHLTRYRSIILTYGEGYQSGYQPLPIYAPYRSDSYRLARASNAIVERVFGSPWLFATTIKKHKVSLLHAHMGPYGIRFLPIKKRFDIPLLTSFHGYDASSFPKNPHNMAALRQLFIEGEMFTVVSEHMRDNLVDLGCPNEKIILHRVGVDVSRFRPRPRSNFSERLTILTVGNFQEKKGFIDLIRAFASVRRHFPQIELRIVGEALRKDAVRPEVEALIEKLGLSGSVVLTGHKAHNLMPREYERADLFVLPSVTAQDGDKEGVPTALMEAQASGLSVVSTYHSGIPDVILDRRSGYLVPEKNVDQLAEKICLLLSNQQAREEMGRLGRTHIEREFNLTVQIRKLEEIYDRICLKRRSSWDGGK